MNEAFKELEDAGQLMFEHQKYSFFFAACAVVIVRFKQQWGL
jgi:hypothetical protein